MIWALWGNLNLVLIKIGYVANTRLVENNKKFVAIGHYCEPKAPSESKAPSIIMENLNPELWTKG